MDSEAADYAEVLGRNLAVARTRLDISQEDVAERMRQLGYAAWARATVSKSERGSRPVTAAEVIGLAMALETTVPGLMAPFDMEELAPVRLQRGARNLFANDVGYVTVGKKIPAGALRWEGNKLVVTARMSPDTLKEMLGMLGLNERGERL